MPVNMMGPSLPAALFESPAEDEESALLATLQGTSMTDGAPASH